MQHLLRRALVVAGIAASCAIPALAASASTADINGTVEAGAGLNVHSGSPTGAVIDTMPGGSTARIYCWQSGPTVSATWGGRTWTTSVWDAVDGYTTPSGQNVDFTAGTKVFASDAWIDTGGDTSKLVAHC
jgi:uncharacterized protein YraI